LPVRNGFVPPAWLCNEGTLAALNKRGYQHVAFLRGLMDLPTETRITSPACVWSVRAAWRRATSLGWNACLAAAQRSNPVLRVDAHPVDFDFPAIARQIGRIVKDALQRRKAVTSFEAVRVARKCAKDAQGTLG